MYKKTDIDETLLEEIIIRLLLKTQEKGDRTYLDTIKRILEGNERSKIASKYVNEKFYRRFPNIPRWVLEENLKRLTEENKIIGYEGRNSNLYFFVNPEYIPKFEKNERILLEDMMLKELLKK